MTSIDIITKNSMATIHVRNSTVILLVTKAVAVIKKTKKADTTIIFINRFSLPVEFLG